MSPPSPSPFAETHGFDADDPILELLVAFREDPRPHKVNLAIGTYKNEEGQSWVLPSVIQAEEALTASRLDKDYLPIDGDPEFLRAVTQLLLGDALTQLTQETESRTVTVQTIGGTSALRLGEQITYASHMNAISMCPTPPGLTTPTSVNKPTCMWDITLTTMRKQKASASTHS